MGRPRRRHPPQRRRQVQRRQHRKRLLRVRHLPRKRRRKHPRKASSASALERSRQFFWQDKTLLVLILSCVAWIIRRVLFLFPSFGARAALLLIPLPSYSIVGLNNKTTFNVY